MADEPQKSDIDFDELDKAVASLMGKVGSETIDDGEQKTKTLAINSTLKPDQAPKYDELEKTAEKIGDETVVTTNNVALPDDINKLPDQMNLPTAEESTPAPSEPASVLNPVTQIPGPAPEPTPDPARETVVPKAAPAPRPNSGRFMDMVHPKADMRASAPTPDLIVPSRTPAAARTAAAPASTHDSAVSEAPEADRAPANPLADSSALATPFLPDAKVEKRPLGGSVSAVVPLSPTNEILSAAEEATATQDSESEESVVETTPINGEVKKVAGSGDAQHELNPADFEKESATEQALAQIEITEEKVPEPPQTIEKVESGDTEHLKSGNEMTYQDAQKEMESGGSAIYDVKNYHQPLAHPKKQKSGWGVVLIVAIIIILAAALGAAAYFILGLGT